MISSAAAGPPTPRVSGPPQPTARTASPLRKGGPTPVAAPSHKPTYHTDPSASHPPQLSVDALQTSRSQAFSVTSTSFKSTATSTNKSQLQTRRPQSPRVIACDTAQIRGEVNRMKKVQAAVSEAESKLTQFNTGAKTLGVQLEELRQRIAAESERRDALQVEVQKLKAERQRLQGVLAEESLHRNAAQDHLMQLRLEASEKENQLKPMIEEKAVAKLKLQRLVERYFGSPSGKGAESPQRSPQGSGASPASPKHSPTSVGRSPRLAAGGAIGGGGETLEVEPEDVEVAVEKQRLELEAVIAHYNNLSEVLFEKKEKVVPEYTELINQLRSELHRQKDSNAELHDELLTIQNEVTRAEEEQRGLTDWSEELVTTLKNQHLAELQRLVGLLEVGE